MIILSVNKFFYRKGGAESVFFNTMKLLERRGHHVIPFSMRHPKNEQSAYADFFVSGVDFRGCRSLRGKIRAASRIIYSFEAKRRLGQLLNRKPVDVAHLHNIYHQLSPSIIVELKQRGIPVVMTLHDYKMVCPTYTLVSDGVVCERCSGGRYWRALGAACGESFAERALLALEMYLHHKVFRLYQLVDIFISPSKFLKDKLWGMGFRREIVVLPNFVEPELYPCTVGAGAPRIVYFGRLSREKGLRTLIEAARGLPGEVYIVGDGPLRAELEQIVKDRGLINVHFLGYLRGEHLFREVASARAVVIPSECYENNPMAVIEAFAMGKPVVGSRIGGIPELVRDGETGLTFEPGNASDLKKKLAWLLEHPGEAAEMGQRAREFVERKLNPERHYEGLMAIYMRAMEKAGKGRG